MADQGQLSYEEPAGGVPSGENGETTGSSTGTSGTDSGIRNFFGATTQSQLTSSTSYRGRISLGPMETGEPFFTDSFDHVVGPLFDTILNVEDEE